MGILAGRKAVITGGGSGIGFEIATRFLNEGADIIISGRTEERLISAVKKLPGDAERKKYYKADIGDEKSVKDLFEYALDIWGGVDILINNAGAMRINKELTETSIVEWNSVINTNINGVFLCSREAAVMMKKQKYGKIINISSMSGEIVNKYFNPGAYEVSKSALRMMTKVFAVELAEYGVAVNAIAPGYYDTKPNRDFFINNMELKSKIMDLIPKKKLGDLNELGRLAVFLSSDGVDYLTGQTIVIDGGYTIW